MVTVGILKSCSHCFKFVGSGWLAKRAPKIDKWKCVTFYLHEALCVLGERKFGTVHTEPAGRRRCYFRAVECRVLAVI